MGNKESKQKIECVDSSKLEQQVEHLRAAVRDLGKEGERRLQDYDLNSNRITKFIETATKDMEQSRKDHEERLSNLLLNLRDCSSMIQQLNERVRNLERCRFDQEARFGRMEKEMVAGLDVVRKTVESNHQSLEARLAHNPSAQPIIYDEKDQIQTLDRQLHELRQRVQDEISRLHKKDRDIESGVNVLRDDLEREKNMRVAADTEIRSLCNQTINKEITACNQTINKEISTIRAEIDTKFSWVWSAVSNVVHDLFHKLLGGWIGAATQQPLLESASVAQPQQQQQATSSVQYVSAPATNGYAPAQPVPPTVESTANGSQSPNNRVETTKTSQISRSVAAGATGWRPPKLQEQQPSALEPVVSPVEIPRIHKVDKIPETPRPTSQSSQPATRAPQMSRTRSTVVVLQSNVGAFCLDAYLKNNLLKAANRGFDVKNMSEEDFWGAHKSNLPMTRCRDALCILVLNSGARWFSDLTPKLPLVEAASKCALPFGFF